MDSDFIIEMIDALKEKPACVLMCTYDLLSLYFIVQNKTIQFAEIGIKFICSIEQYIFLY